MLPCAIICPCDKWLPQHICTKELEDIWKKNILEDLEVEKIKFELLENSLVELKRKFRKGNNKLAKMVKLKQVEQDLRTIEKFVQEFK